MDESRNHIIYHYYYDTNSLALLRSNAQSSCRYVHSQTKDRSLLSGNLLALKAQRQGSSIKNLLKPSLPNQSSVCFSGSLDFKNLGRITTGSTMDKKSIHICWLCFLQNCYINNMISIKILDKINYFGFSSVDNKFLKCRGCIRWTETAYTIFGSATQRMRPQGTLTSVLEYE